MILNTRPVEYAAAFESEFSGLGHEIVASPVLRVEPLPAVTIDASAFDALVLTSQVALAHMDAAGWHGTQVFAVGAATAAAARARGFRHVTCTGENAADLLVTLKAAGFARGYYPSAETVAADLQQALPGRVVRQAIYRAVPCGKLDAGVAQRIAAGEPTYVPLFSARSAAAFESMLRAAALDPSRRNLTIVAISKAAARGPWRRPLIAPRATAAGVAHAMRGTIAAGRAAA